MVMVTLEERTSRLEGITEQINERLGNLEHGQASLRQELQTEIHHLRDEMRTQFHWMMGTSLGVGVAILGVMVASLTR